MTDTVAVDQEKDNLRAELSKSYSDVYDRAEMQELFSVVSFAAPFVEVTRKSDGVRGHLQFTHMPRLYFNFAGVGNFRGA